MTFARPRESVASETIEMTHAIVECYAGHRYPERPRAFLWGEERVAVEEVERQWRTPEGPVFRVRTADGRRFTLAYDEVAETWSVRRWPP
jgi:hypothetical protein